MYRLCGHFLAPQPTRSYESERAWDRCTIDDSRPVPKPPNGMLNTLAPRSERSENALHGRSTLFGLLEIPHLARQHEHETGPCRAIANRYNGFMARTARKYDRRKIARFTTWYTLTKSNMELCVYCGMLATNLDHFPPVSSMPRVGVLLPACGECNRFARDLYPYDFSKRLQHVKDRIRWKYRRILQTPAWSADELDELSGSMRREIARWRDVRRITHGRLAWDAIAHLRHFVSTPSFAAHGAESARTRDIAVSLLKLYR